jgi:tRNA nucleotidyltransferase (CCA-adding enzyme)
LKSYLVGGAVRDRLLEREVKERDYVVVGATPQQMTAAGYRQVGKAFPVFLHPKTKEEYALARRGRDEVGQFGPEVTLEDDLQRRDLTINALAEDENGAIIDCCGGLQDLEDRVLRHTSNDFIEDPIRILRVARFAARYADLGFRVAKETEQLMSKMVEEGAMEGLVAERVWQELGQALAEPTPTRFFDVLRKCGALKKLLPELDILWGVPQPEKWHPEIDTGDHTMMVLACAAKRSHEPEVRFAALVHDLGKGTTPPEKWPSHRGHEESGVKLIEQLCERLKVPNRFCDLARMAARYHTKLHHVNELRDTTVLKMLEGLDAFRRPERFAQFILVCESDFRGRAGFFDRPYRQAGKLLTLFGRAASVDCGAVAQNQSDPAKIEVAIQCHRLAAMREEDKVAYPANWPNILNPAK